MSLDDHTATMLFRGLKPEQTAVFLDFDGVLVDLAEGPKQINVPAGLYDLLQTLNRRTSGATAIVTGRSIDDFRSYLADPVDWIAGSHGGERVMDGESSVPHALTRSQEVMAVQSKVLELNDVAPGVELELKPLGAVIHYRRAPEHAEVLRHAALEIAEAHEAFEVHEAKMAFELRPVDVGKGKVLEDWMKIAPFRGRTPVYFGDDLTDEPALDFVEKRQGIAVKVGEGITKASSRVDRPSDVLEALQTWLQMHD